MRTPKAHYVDNAEIFVPLAEYSRAYKIAKKAGEQTPRVPHKVAKAIMLIADNLATKGNFSGYSFIEEMKLDGIENCIRYVHNFNPDTHSNAFGYITLIMYRAFVRRISREKFESAVKHKLLLNHSDVFDAMSMEGGRAVSNFLDTMSIEKSAEIVEAHEQRAATKKAKAKIKAEK